MNYIFVCLLSASWVIVTTFDCTTSDCTGGCYFDWAQETVTPSFHVEGSLTS